MREVRGKGPVAVHQQAWKDEHRNTVTTPMLAHLVMNDNLNEENLTAEYCASVADLGNPAFMYMAGIKYKNRLLGATVQVPGRDRRGGGRPRTNRSLITTNSADQPGVLETNELAYKYLLKGAQAGHGLSMVSLADCYENCTGVRKDMRKCREWLWEACLQKSAAALETLDTKCTLPRELVAIQDGLERMPQYLQPGQVGGLGGPNLASFIMSMHERVAAMNYTVPAFAATTPTLSVGNRPQMGTTGPQQIIGAEGWTNFSGLTTDEEVLLR